MTISSYGTSGFVYLVVSFKPMTKKQKSLLLFHVLWNSLVSVWFTAVHVVGHLVLLMNSHDSDTLECHPNSVPRTCCLRLFIVCVTILLNTSASSVSLVGWDLLKSHSKYKNLKMLKYPPV